MKIVLLFVLSCFSAIAPSCLYGINYAWNGSSGNWSDATKWAPNGIPGPGDNVLLPGGTCTLTAATTVNDLALSGGCTLTGNFNVNVEGTLSIGDCNFTGAATVTVTGATVNTGASNLNNRGLVMNGGGTSSATAFIFSAQITIPAGRTFTKTTSASENWFSGGPFNGLITVQGTLAKTGPGAWGLGSYRLNCNGGTINVSQGGLTYGLGGEPVGTNAFSGAAINLATGTSLGADGDNSSFTNCIIGGDGTLDLHGGNQSIVSGNTITCRLRVAGPTSINQNITPSFYTVAGSAAGLTGTGNTTISGNMVMSAGTISNTGAWSIGGNFTWSGGDFGGIGTATVAGATAFASPGLVRLLDGRTLVLNGGGSYSSGEMRLAGGSTLRNAPGSTLTLSPGNPNTANINLQAGGGTILNEGMLVKSGTGSSAIAPTFTNSGTFRQTAGTTTFSAAFTNSGALEGTGTLVFNSSFAQNGTISPGLSPGMLTISKSSVALGVTAVLNTQLQDGSGPGTGHDQLVVTGTIALDGALNVSETGVVPPGTYTILRCDGGPGCRTGTFGNASLPACYTLDYTGNAVLLTKVPPPTAAIDGDLDICAGASTLLTASGGTAYAWSSGPTTATVTLDAAGIYTVTVSDPTGCTAQASATLTVHALPTVSISGDPDICAGETTELTASGGEAYTWNTGPGTAAISVTTAGNYQVTATDANGCTNTAVATVTLFALPLATITGPLEICPGGSVELAASGGDTYAWSTGATTAVVTLNTEGTYTVTVTGAGACTATASATTAVDLLLAKAAVKMFLQGPYVSAVQLMHDSLRAKGLIPLTEPYTGLSNFTHVGGGGEATTPVVLGVTGPNAIVDWVFLELRSAADPLLVLATRSALLQRDGDVVDVDGISPVGFGIAAGASYYLVARHRNHLGVQLGAAVPYPLCTVVHSDFTTSPPQGFYNFNGLNTAEKPVGNAYALWSANGRIDFQLKYNGSNNDRNTVLSVVGLSTPNNTVTGYQLADYNLDGLVKYNGSGNDRNVLLGNVGISTPSAIVHDQIAH